MARTGKDSWEKYFKNKIVNTIVEKEGKTKAGILLNYGTKIKVFGGDAYDSQLKIIFKYQGKDNLTDYFSIYNIMKPSKSNASMKIEASKLIEGGEDKILNFFGTQAFCKVFKSVKGCMSSMISCLEEEQSVPERVSNILKTNIQNLLSNKKIQWGDKITRSEIIELGKGGPGELFSACMNFIDSNAIAMIFPNDPAFKGVDFGLLYQNKELIYYSNKFGKVGGKMSINPYFSDIYHHGNKKSIIHKLSSIYVENNHDPKKTIYDFMTKKLNVSIEKDFNLYNTFIHGDKHNKIKKICQIIKVHEGFGKESRSKRISELYINN